MSYRCDPPQLNQETRSLFFCVSSQDQPDGLYGTRVTINSPKKKIYSTAIYDKNYSSCGQDCFYTCLTIESIPLDTEYLSVSYKFPDNKTCLTEKINTQPPYQYLKKTETVSPTPATIAKDSSYPSPISTNVTIPLYVIIGLVTTLVSLLILNYLRKWNS